MVNKDFFIYYKMKKKYLTTSAKNTKKIAREFGREILKNKTGKNALIIGLEGELGAGKTCFLQGLSSGLKIKEKILSPTFIIFKKFKIQNSLFHFFYHFDCYRIQNEKEILKLGFKEIISDPKNIVAIEWAERTKKIIPQKNIWLKFKIINQKTREIKINQKLKLH